MNNIESYLIQYLELGLHPIPLKGKEAKYHWKAFNLSKGDIDRYKQHSNWGLRTEIIKPELYFYVIDLDSKDKIADFWETINLPPATPIVQTGRGYHFYLTWRSEVKTTHFGWLDIIGNGYVVCPPSIHPNGKQYKFIVPLNGKLPPLMDPETIKLPKMINHSSGSRAGSTKPMTGKLTMDQIENGVSEGLRHTTLVGYIGALIKSCFREEEALVKILSWNKKNRPPLPEGEVNRTVHNLYEKWG
jgi:hypothetical protein